MRRYSKKLYSTRKQCDSITYIDNSKLAKINTYMETRADMLRWGTPVPRITNIS